MKLRAPSIQARHQALALACLFLSACSNEGDRSGDDSQSDGNSSGAGGSSNVLPSGGAPAGGSGIEVDPDHRTGGGGGAGGDSSELANGECAQVDFQTVRKPVDMLLLLDRSASMQENEIEDGVTRWDGVVSVVNQALLATNTAVSWGLKSFPEKQGDEYYCTEKAVSDEIDVPIAPLNGPTVVDQIAITTPEGDGTPTGAAIDSSVNYLDAIPNDNPKYILLATDGEPSCDGNGLDSREYAIDAAERAYAQDIPVFVIGVLDPDPSDGTIETLDGIAVAGGRPRASADSDAYRFYLASSSDELLAALNEITGEVATCVFPFDSAPPDPSNIAVTINGERIEQDTTHSVGWDYVGDEYRAIEVFGALCDDLKATETSQIEIIFGCAGVVIR